MNPPYLASGRSLSRRHFLKGTGGALLSLPLLEAMSPAFVRGRSSHPPKRLVAMCATLGFHAPSLFPSTPGREYEMTPYLSRLKDHRNDFTILSGLSHPDQQGNNGHSSEMTWLTSARRPGLSGFKNSISLDQLIAAQIGMKTRHPYLALSTNGRSMSWTANGVAIPGETSPGKLFKSLFIDGTEAEVVNEMKAFKRGRSILDTVLGEAKKLERKVGHRDREKLDEYLTSVRNLEVRLQEAEDWVQKPKPTVTAPQPKDIDDQADAIGKQRLMNDMIILALQTDSTRTVTFQLAGMNSVPAINGVNTDWHNLSHHGKDPEKIGELKLIEEAEFSVFNEFLTRLKSIDEQGESLLDNTSVLFGSNLGNASSHDWRNLPVILAGGGYRHGSYLAHDETDNTPFANLFVSLAQHMGVEIDTFGSSTAAGITGLESA
ncbi:MAG: DUF1552 domain-containing protein [Verrucomicrobiales bacterium]|nr:DUF1552 domain-containing protein [Verrucomicrobiales bacterium]